jgi:hypothetical protein
MMFYFVTGLATFAMYSGLLYSVFNQDYSTAGLFLMCLVAGIIIMAQKAKSDGEVESK